MFKINNKRKSVKNKKFLKILIFFPKLMFSTSSRIFRPITYIEANKEVKNFYIFGFPNVN